MAGRVRVTSINAAGLRADANRMSAADIRRTTRRILNQSTVNCPVDSGRLRASGRMKFREAGLGPTGTVEYPVEYAAAVHDRTRPHIIRAKKKKALAFKMEGRTVVVRSVRHPGTEGRPFLREAASEVARSMGYEFIWRN